MAIDNTIRLKDEMSPVFKRVVKSINDTMKAMAMLDGSSGAKQAAKEVEKIYKNFADVKKEVNGGVNPAVARASKEIENVANGIDKANRGLQNAKDSTVGWQMMVMGVNQALQLGSAILSQIGKLTGLSDEMATTKARLDLMNDGHRTTLQLQEQIYQSAQRSRGSYQDTADAVSKMGLMAKDAFGSNDELVAFMEQVNKQFTIAGTETAGRQAAMLQLTQAMGMGVLRGQELNSIFEQAPTMIESIATYLDVPIGKIREMASEGLLTADVVKKALISTADETNTRFESMPMTFAQVATSIQNQALMMFQPALDKLSQLVNSEGFQALVSTVITILGYIAEVATTGIGWIVESISWIGEYAAFIEPLITAILVGLAAHFVLVHAEAWKASIMTGIQTLATWQAAAATQGLTLAQYALNAALNANPLMWIATLIGIVVAAIIHLWRTNLDFKYGFLNIWDSIVFAFEVYLHVWRTISYSMQNVMDDMWHGIVSGAEWGVNNVLEGLNSMINALNKIPGVNLEVFEKVDWAASTALENEAKKQARQADLDENWASIEANKAAREANRAAQRAEEEANIAANEAGGGGAPDYGALIAGMDAGAPVEVKGGKLNSVDKINEDVSITDEDLKLLRDVAQTEYINQFTTLRPEMRVVVENVNENADVNGVLEDFARQLSDAVGEVIY